MALLPRTASQHALDEAPDERVLIDSARPRPGLALAGLRVGRIIGVPGCGPMPLLLQPQSGQEPGYAIATDPHGGALFSGRLYPARLRESLTGQRMSSLLAPVNAYLPAGITCVPVRHQFRLARLLIGV